MGTDWRTLLRLLVCAKAGLAAAFTWAAWLTGGFSFVFSLVAIACAVRFFRLRRLADPRELPPVTILKPLKGVDRDLYENLATFCRLDYPRFQLLFTLASPDDPALGVLARLRRDFPQCDIEIVVSKNRIGYNPKINNVSNSQPYIKHDVLLFSDSDIRVRRDFLRRMVAPLNDARVGLVTCFYQSTTPRGLWSRLEALSVNAHFLPQAVTAAAFGMRFAMGAAILVRREPFERSGGFANMANHLADDFILGKSVSELGYRVEIADCVVESVPDVAGPIEHLRHQARWARTIRICNPSGYFASVINHGFSLLTLKLLLFGFDPASAILLLNLFAAKALAKYCLSRTLGDKQLSSSALLVPLSEWIAFGAWIAGIRSTRVLWRGEVYAVHPQGRLVPVGSGLPPAVSVPAAVPAGTETAS